MSPLSFPRTFKPFGKEQLLTNLYKIRGGKRAEFCSGENSEGGQGAAVAAGGYAGSRHVKRSVCVSSRTSWYGV